DWFLRVYIDSESEDTGIGTDDCEKVSRFLSGRLDELDPIEQNYYLEVSSPGMDRALLKDSDYEKYAGKMVDITLYKAIDGKKNISGILEGIVD
ncbi:MAG: ribosome maturation factor RimP, partial [Anaerovorax sp.]